MERKQNIEEIFENAKEPHPKSDRDSPETRGSSFVRSI
jgi:hypothetical protein